MPIRDYTCKSCGEEFEYITYKASDEVECPKCQGKDLEAKTTGYMALYSVKGDNSGSTPSKRRYKKFE